MHTRTHARAHTHIHTHTHTHTKNKTIIGLSVYSQHTEHWKYPKVTMYAKPNNMCVSLVRANEDDIHAITEAFL